MTPKVSETSSKVEPVTTPVKSKPISSETTPVQDKEKAHNIKLAVKELPIPDKDTSNKKHDKSIKPLSNKEPCDEKSIETKKSKTHRTNSPEKLKKSVPSIRKSRSRSKNRIVPSIVKDSKKDRKKTPTKVEGDARKDNKDHSRSEAKHDRTNRDRTGDERRHENRNRSNSESTKKPRDRNSSDNKSKSSNRNSSKEDANKKRESSSQRHSSSNQTESRKRSDSTKNSTENDKNRLSSTKEKQTEKKKVEDKSDKSRKSETKPDDSNKLKRDTVKDSSTNNKNKESLNHRTSDAKKSSNDDRHRAPPKPVKKEQDQVRRKASKSPQKCAKKELESKNSQKSHSPVRRDVPKPLSKKKVRQELRPTLSFADELPEVQGLKPAEDETPSPTENKRAPFLQRELNVKPPSASATVLGKSINSTEDDISRNNKKSEHAEMLKQVESNVEEILAPLSEIEKLALDRKSLKPEDLLNKMMDLMVVTPEKKNVDVIKHEEIKEVPKFSLYDPIDTNLTSIVKFSDEPIKTEELKSTVAATEPKSVLPIEVKLESEYETFINSLTTSGEEKLDESQQVVNQNSEVSTIKPKKKDSRSLSTSTSSSHTSGTTTSSTNDSSSESSSSSDSDSSNSSSESGSDSDSDSSDSKESKQKSKVQKKIDVTEAQSEEEPPSPSQTPPRQLLPLKIEATVSSTVGSQESVLVPLPEHREKIQMNLIQKTYTINKHLNDSEVVSVELYFHNFISYFLLFY